MSWLSLQVEDYDNLKIYSEVVLQFFASDEYYEEKSEIYLSKQLSIKKENLYFFLYNENDSNKKMVFGIKWSNSYKNPYTNDKGMWKVIDLSYTGDWSNIDNNGISIEALNFGIISVRSILKFLKIEQVYLILNMETRKLEILENDLKIQKNIFLKFINKISKLPEITEIIPMDDKTHYVCHINWTNIQIDNISFDNDKFPS